MTPTLRWKPVIVGFKGTAPRSVGTADEAASVLLHSLWPDIHTTLYVAARAAVLAEMERRAPIASARLPFIAAAREAGIIVNAA